jgi:hypothetical protein
MWYFNQMIEKKLNELFKIASWNEMCLSKVVAGG